MTDELRTDDRVLERYDVGVVMPNGVTYMPDERGVIEYLGAKYRIAAEVNDRTSATAALPRHGYDQMTGLLAAFTQQVQQAGMAPQPAPYRVLRKVTEVREPWFAHEATKASS